LFGEIGHLGLFVLVFRVFGLLDSTTTFGLVCGPHVEHVTPPVDPAIMYELGFFAIALELPLWLSYCQSKALGGV
jgi:hypothetical protein